MKALAIAGIGLRALVRDRTSLFFLVIFPIGLILVIGTAFGGDYTPRLGVVDQSQGRLSAALVAELDRLDHVRVERVDDPGALRTAVERGELTGGVTIPAGYDSGLRAGGAVKVGYLARQDQNGAQLGVAVRSAVARQDERLRAARFAQAENGTTFDGGLAAVDRVAPSVPGVSVRTGTAGKALFPESMGRFDLGASSQLLLFTFMTSLTGAVALIEGRRLGVTRRMLATPTRVRTIVFGEALGRVAIALTQGVIIMAGAALIFGVNWGDPLAAVALLLAFCLVAGGAAMVIGAVLRTEQQAGAIGVLLGIGLAALGGSMVPLEIFSDGMRTVAHLTPHAWANEAFAELVRRDGALPDILPQLGVLLGYATVLFGAGGLLLRRSLS